MTEMRSEFVERDEDGIEDFELYQAEFLKPTDDVVHVTNYARQIEQMLDSITRVGGEVQRLRTEVDGLLHQNLLLVDTFHKLKYVIGEKGVLDTDDFDLACDVFDEMNTKSLFEKAKLRN